MLSGADGNDPWEHIGVARIDVLDRAACDLTLYDDGIRQLVERDLGRVARAAGDLEATVDARHRLADDALRRVLVRRRHRACPSRRVSARTSVRCARSILNALCVRGTAFASAARAASR